MKKFLSLVLALVMTMSLVTVSAGAKDFGDNGDINYKEAVDVMSALEIIDGYSNGDFQPQGTLTRGAAAKIIACMMLGKTTAESLGTQAAPFKDVPVGSTFAGYIAYCVESGLIDGYADGTFRPQNTLTGFAFLKMLLTALGYDSAVEGFTGSNWTVNVIKQAVGIGLDDGNDNFVGSQAVTREEAALYAFNMLNATMVEYDQQNTIVIGDITINTTSSRKDVANTTSSDGNIDNDDLMQFAERYFTDLSKRDGATDEFERPSTTWRLKSTTIGTYADEPDATYTSATRIGDIYSDLGLDDGISKNDVTMYEDGVDAGSFRYDVVRGERTKIGGDGSLLDVYYDDDADTLTLVLVNTYVGKVSSARAETSTRDAYVTVSTADSFTKPAAAAFDNTFDTDEFDKDDIVYYTYSMKSGENCIESMGLAEAVTGTMSRYTTEGSVTVAGTKYDANVKSATNIYNLASTVDRSKDVTVYLDPYGYALYVDADTSVEYAVVLNYTSKAGDFNDTAKAELLFTDGTTKTVEVDYTGSVALDSNNIAVATPTDNSLNKYDIVSYSVDSDDVYDITLVADSQTSYNNAEIVTNGAAQVYLTQSKLVSTEARGKTSRNVDGKTIFLVADTTGSKTTYSAYEGIANVPTISVAGGATTVSAYMEGNENNGVIKVVFVLKGNTVSVISDNEDVVYIKGSSTGTSYTSDLGYFYEYDAFINGEPTTVKTSAQYTSDALIYGPVYNDKGIMTGAQNSVTSAKQNDGSLHYVVGTDSVTNNVIKLGGNAFAYVSDVNAYYINIDGDLVSTDITAFAEDADDQVFYKTNDKGLLTDVYVKVVDATTPVTPGATNGIAAIGATGGSGVLYLNLQTNSTVPTTADIKATVTVSVLNGGTWVKMRDVEITIPAGADADDGVANGWGTQVTLGGLSAGQYKVTCGDLPEQFATVTA